MSSFVCFFTLGVFYSCGFLVWGSYASYFVSYFSVVHALLLGVLTGGLAWALRELTRRWILVAGLGSLLSLHFGVWLFSYSSIQDGTWVTLLAFSAICAVGLFVLVGLFDGLEPDSIRGYAGFAVVVVLLLIGKWTLVVNLPQSVVVDRSPGHFRSRSMTLSKVFYPLSLPLDESAWRYSFLLPDWNPDKSVVFLVLDALRKDFVGRTLHGRSVTPTMDRFASEGVSFDRYYVQGTWTKSSTASLFTGRYPHDHGVCASRSESGQALPRRYRTLAERLKQQGFYTVGSVMASHLNRGFNFDQGFDYWLAPDTNYRFDYVSLQSILLELIRRQPEKMFVYYHMIGPHSPYKYGLNNTEFWKRSPFFEDGNVVFGGWRLPHPTEITRGKLDDWTAENPSYNLSNREIRIFRYLYASQLNFYDREHVDRSLRALKGLGLYDESLVTITGDHGEDLFDLGFEFSREARRHFGHLYSLRELVINPPLLLKAPGSQEVQELDSSREPILESLDLGATILEYGRADRSDWSGTSFWRQWMRGSFGQRFRTAVAEDCFILDAFEETGRTLTEFSPEALREYMIVNEGVYVRDNWKLVMNFKDDRSALYNLGTDPDERNPMTSDSQRMKAMREAYYDSMLRGDPRMKSPPGPFLPLSEEEKKNLQGLGYIN